jgi:hypothetical protein
MRVTRRVTSHLKPNIPSPSTTSTTRTRRTLDTRAIPVPRGINMQATTETDPVLRWAARRAEINRANSEHSTGPRTESSKKRSSQNALRHGLTCRTAVLPTEDQAAYKQHCRQFRDEYQPANTSETQLVQELTDTSWRLELLELHNRRGIPWQPADHGFVFSKEQVERHDELLMRQNEARHCAWPRYEMPPTLMRNFIE